MREWAHKKFAITPPAAIVDNASLTTAAIDTAGFDLCKVVVFLGATDIAMTALKVQESDASDMTGAADITGAVFGTSDNDAGSTSTLPSATADNSFFEILIRCGGNRKRYLDLVATCGDGEAGTYITAWAELYRGEQTPVTASECGVSQRLLVA